MKRLRRRGSQRGFTLIELMVALVISSLLVGMILAIFLRMSLAYRSQQQVANLQQLLASARATFEIDALQSGMQMSQGFRLGTDGAAILHPSVRVINSSIGPDQVGFYYGDPSSQAVVTAGTALSVTVDNVVGFANGDLVLMSTPDLTTQNPLGPGVDANIVTYAACVLKISAVAGTTMSFTTALPWGSGGNLHCGNPPVAGKTMVFKFVARSYRIDPTRPADGVLQVSPTGNLAGLNDWQDLAYGFTDIQVATQFFDFPGVDNADPDTDAARNWYSGDDQTTLTTKDVLLRPPIQMVISLVARTDRNVEGIATAATPTLTVTANPASNSLGDRPSVTLPSATDLALQGDRIYRYTTFQVDLRNTGVGR